jgi:hypothetical protein
MIRDRMLGRLGPEPGTDVTVKPRQPTQFVPEVERGVCLAVTKGGERRGTPSSGFSKQFFDLLG